MLIVLFFFWTKNWSLTLIIPLSSCLLVINNSGIQRDFQYTPTNHTGLIIINSEFRLLMELMICKCNVVTPNYSVPDKDDSKIHLHFERMLKCLSDVCFDIITNI